MREFRCAVHSLTPAVDGNNCELHVPAAFPSEKEHRHLLDWLSSGPQFWCLIQGDKNSRFFVAHVNMIPQLSNLKPRYYFYCSIRVFKTFSYLSQYDLQAGRYSPLSIATCCCVQNSCTVSTQCAQRDISSETERVWGTKVSTYCDTDVYIQWHCAYWQHMAFRV